MIITIDGPTASGKSTVAQKLAQRLGYTYINSGLLFRAAAYLHAQGKSLTQDLFDDALRYSYTSKDGAHIWYQDKDITPLLKTPEVDQKSSQIALNPDLRQIILEVQRTIAQKDNVIADGRDCGTVIFPDADYKFFITADVVIRAQRWQQDQARKGFHYDLNQSIKIITERDARDSERSIAPLTIPDKAIIIDTSSLTIDEVVNICLKHIQHPTSR